MMLDAQANLRTLRDVLRYAVTRFNENSIFFGHGQIDAFDEAAFLVTRAMSLPLERMDIFLDAFLTHAEINTLIEMIESRVKRRLPAAYLIGEAWLQGYRFSVDSRVIIPRSGPCTRYSILVPVPGAWRSSRRTCSPTPRSTPRTSRSMRWRWLRATSRNTVWASGCVWSNRICSATSARPVTI
jgi:hypothetical protein